MSPPFDEPAISLFVREHEEPGIEVRVNFGLFAGRHATPAEIDDLAASLRELVPEFAIVAKDGTGTVLPPSRTFSTAPSVRPAAPAIACAFPFASPSACCSAWS